MKLSRCWLSGLTAIALMTTAACRPTASPEITVTAPTERETPAASADATRFIGAENEITATQPWRILFALKDTYDPETGEHGDLYQEQVWQGAQAAAADFGVEVELLGNPCHTCVEDQIRAIDARLEAGDIDGLTIMATDSVRLARVVEKAIANGVPVVAMDTPVNTDELLSFVVFDNFAGGRVMGEW
ncbi:MAG: sugar ABC transporter substrate-binding protein, partial [Spirulinaceae cyanobacterium RM2_2_10]|nr:sugar ABC transporter substrate-binding protein [Spirulinaceae cyanobacterium RM2_2_10]